MRSFDLSDIWERIALSHTTHVISSLDFEVSVITPLFTPRILNNIIIHSIFSTITNSNNSMIDIFWSILTNITGIYTTSVVFEPINNFKGNRNRSVCSNSLFKTLFIISCDIKTTMSLANTSPSSISTFSILSIVWVILFSSESIVFNIFKSMRW